MFQLPDSDEKVVLLMTHRANEESAKNLRKGTLLKAIRAIWGKPKVSFVPLYSNKRSDVYYFPEDCVMINKDNLGLTVKVAMVKQNSLIEGMFSDADRAAIQARQIRLNGWPLCTSRVKHLVPLVIRRKPGVVALKPKRERGKRSEVAVAKAREPKDPVNKGG